MNLPTIQVSRIGPLALHDVLIPLKDEGFVQYFKIPSVEKSDTFIKVGVISEDAADLVLHNYRWWKKNNFRLGGTNNGFN